MEVMGVKTKLTVVKSLCNIHINHYVLHPKLIRWYISIKWGQGEKKEGLLETKNESKQTYFNIIKATCNKPTANITQWSKTESFPCNIRTR